MKMVKNMRYEHAELLENFYGISFNKDFLVKGLDWDDYPEYKRHYPKSHPINNSKRLVKRMDMVKKKYKQTMNTYISAYDYDHDHDIHQFHLDHGNYLETPYGLKLKPYNERTIYPYNKHIILDRIFHDFDSPLSFEDEQMMKDPAIAIHDKREHMRTILFQKHIAEKPLRYAKQLGDFYQRMGLKPTYVFSGKGIHLYIHFRPIRLEFPNYVLNELYKAIKQTFKFDEDIFDKKVFEPARKSRILTSRNPKTDYYVKPINPNWEYFELLDDVESPSINVDVDVNDYGDDSKIIEVLTSHDEIAKQLQKEQRIRNQMMPSSRPRIHANKNQTIIANPDDVVKLMQYPCFNDMKFSDYNNLVLVNILSFTDLKDANDVQDAMLKFWENKGFTKMQKNQQGFHRVKENDKKYSFTQNTMKRIGLCQECQDWQRCFRYNMKLNQVYDDKLETYKNGLD